MSRNRKRPVAGQGNQKPVTRSRGKHLSDWPVQADRGGKQIRFSAKPEAQTPNHACPKAAEDTYPGAKSSRFLTISKFPE